MSTVRAPRWAPSFADLCLLLLGFFVLLHARKGDPAAVSQGMRAAFGDETPQPAPATLRAAALFVPGEAVLTAAGAADLARIGRGAAQAGAGVLIVSEGTDGGTPRLDGWELAAARAAAAARAIRAGGLADRAVTISIPAMAGAASAGQTLRIIRSGPAGDGRDWRISC